MKNLLLALTAAFVLAASAQAQTVITITGATAFRAAALTAIRAQYNAGGNHSITCDNATFNSSNRVTFVGTFPGIAGSTVVHCSWSGSTEGVRDVRLSNTVQTYDENTASNFSPAANPATPLVRTSGTVPAAVMLNTHIARFSFSDVRQQNTPHTTLPADPRIGTIVFVPIKNDGAPAGLTNLNKQSWSALLDAGLLPLRFFTGLAADTTNIYAVGRNDGSGTRTAYLMESGLAPNKLVKQYAVTQFTGDVNDILQLIPAGGGTAADQVVGSPTFGLPIASPQNASTLWGQDLDGNGGYFSGGDIRTIMGKKTNNIETRDETGGTIEGPGAIVGMVSVVSFSDANNAVGAGASALTWNGVGVTPGASISAADRAKIANGQYTAWNYQNLYFRSPALVGAELTLYNALKNNATGVPANIGSSGLNLTEMAPVSRADDGAPVGL